MDTANTTQKGEAQPVSVLKSAALMGLGTLSSRVLGLVREMLLLALFPRMVSDAFVVAFKLPNLFRRVLGEGSLAATFLPLYVDANTHDKEEAKRFRDAVYSMLSALTATLSVLGIVFMDPILKLVVQGDEFMSIPGKYELTLLMARVMFGFLYLVTTYAFLMSVANAHKIFFVPAMAPAAFNFFFIVMMFIPSISLDGDQLAWSVIVGGIVQMAMAAWPLVKFGYWPRFNMQWMAAWNSPRIQHFFRNLVPSMIGMSIAQLLGILNVYFASSLEQGTLSYIYSADRILEIPQSLLSVSLGVALLPTLSEFWARGEKDKMLDVSQRHIRLLLVLSLPAAVGLYVLAQPIVEVIYMRGKFLPHEAAITAQVVAIYAFVLVFSGVHRVTVPVFYAIKNTWLPAANSAVTLVVHFFLAGYATEQWGIRGLVGATAVTGLLNLVILLVAHQILIGSFGLWRLLKSAAWQVPALAGLYFTALYSYAFFAAHMINVFALILAIGISAAVYFGVASATRHPESREILGLLLRRFRRKAAK